MTYQRTLEHTPIEECWRLVRRWMESEPLPFYRELRRERPILRLPGLVLASRSALSTARPFTVDTLAPSLAISRDKTALLTGETATIPFAFSEDPGTSFS